MVDSMVPWSIILVILWIFKNVSKLKCSFKISKMKLYCIVEIPYLTLIFLSNTIKAMMFLD